MSQGRIGLLVSVRNAEEAAAALAGGADLVDAKEPNAGSLGAVSRSTLRGIEAQVAGRVPLSAALGELRDWENEKLKLPAGVSLAKLGLSGVLSNLNWVRRWHDLLNQLAPQVGRVAVIYADWREAAAPPPEEVVLQGHQLGCSAVLIDTFDKSRGDLLSHCSSSELARLVDKIRLAGMSVALAGSLNRETMAQLVPLRPNWLAVRTAACAGGRLGVVRADLVRELARHLQACCLDRAAPTRRC